MAYDRRSIDLTAFPDLVVVYLGYRVRGLGGLRSMWRIGQGLAALRRDPPPGLLCHEGLMFGLLQPGFRQYWRDFDSLEAFTRAAAHKGWWGDFARSPNNAGIWHEVYRLRGGMEAIYSGMPPIGLAAFAPSSDPTGPRMTARQRLG